MLPLGLPGRSGLPGHGPGRRSSGTSSLQTWPNAHPLSSCVTAQWRPLDQAPAPGYKVVVSQPGPSAGSPQQLSLHLWMCLSVLQLHKNSEVTQIFSRGSSSPKVRKTTESSPSPTPLGKLAAGHLRPQRHRQRGSANPGVPLGVLPKRGAHPLPFAFLLFLFR